MEKIRLLSTTSAHDRDADIMARMEDLHGILEEIALEKKGSLVRDGAHHHRWDMVGAGVLYIEPNDGEDHLTQNRDISIEWEAEYSSEATSACINIANYPMPAIYSTNDQLREWIGTLAGYIRLALNAYGRKPVLLGQDSVEKSAYDAALAVSSLMNDKVAAAYPAYSQKNPEWRIVFPTPWADGKIQNEQVELSFEQEIPAQIYLCQVTVRDANPPIFDITNFVLSRNSEDIGDPINRLAAHKSLGSLSAYCCGKDVA